MKRYLVKMPEATAPKPKLHKSCTVRFRAQYYVIYEFSAKSELQREALASTCFRLVLERPGYAAVIGEHTQSPSVVE